MFFGSTSHFSIVDTWRFWIIHLWVEGFFELFVTVMVATIFFRLNIISHLTAARVVYLDAILYLGSGIIGTGHHWYWTGQSTITMALAATSSAMEVVPLTLLWLNDGEELSAFNDWLNSSDHAAPLSSKSFDVDPYHVTAIRPGSPATSDGPG